MASRKYRIVVAAVLCAACICVALDDGQWQQLFKHLLLERGSERSGFASNVANRDQRWKASQHSNNWAVIVCASRFWFNYRHAANALSVYHTVKRLGIPDSHVILMMAEDMASNQRNGFPGEIYNHESHAFSLQDGTTEIDYVSREVTADSLLAVLTDRHQPGTPAAKRLLSDANSNVLVYMTGHGGDGFLKFHDVHELLATQIGEAVDVMWATGRYRHLALLVDTCQAASLGKHLNAPNTLVMASSEIGENSYSHHGDARLGLTVVDRFTYHVFEYLRRLKPESRATFEDLVKYIRPLPLLSTLSLRTDRFPAPLDRVPLTDFFAHRPDLGLIPTLHLPEWHEAQLSSSFQPNNNATVGGNDWRRPQPANLLEKDKSNSTSGGMGSVAVESRSGAVVGLEGGTTAEASGSCTVGPSDAEVEELDENGLQLSNIESHVSYELSVLEDGSLRPADLEHWGTVGLKGAGWGLLALCLAAALAGCGWSVIS